ncbi:hypothetical protein BDN72DRAFT_845170 [Pluteus cervinus]|uniref:Uncharacterized protein n=1 Tax=Pluteus cervinus TaxID=181527 RepID=A0ACD3AKA3_9AGAR|nr:hypothetical protein BDN72DRAFT_845170 [Pluteus cervinus]
MLALRFWLLTWALMLLHCLRACCVVFRWIKKRINFHVLREANGIEFFSRNCPSAAL